MSHSNYKVLKLLKNVDNRLCADCSVPLGEGSASLTYRVWICSYCAEIHKRHLNAVVKDFHDVWTDDEAHAMESAKSNVAVNKVLERFVPKDWPRIDSQSSYTDRKHWIRARYYSMYFALPQYQSSTISMGRKGKKDSLSRDARIVQDKTLPSRMVDFFMTVELGRCTAQGKAYEPGFKDVCSLQFSPTISNCVPDANKYPDTPIPDLVGPIVFPQGLTLSLVDKPPFCFSYVMTNINRVKLYGTVLIVYELADPDHIVTLLAPNELSVFKAFMQSNPSQVLYAPKALTVISHYGFFHLFTKFLEQIYHVSLSAAPLPLERYITNFTMELPLAPQGITEIFFTLPESVLRITRPPKNRLPMVDFSYRPLFTCLSVDNILSIFSCLCAEMTICICASNIALLTPVQEALLSLLFPFVWQGCYVPVLPVSMMELLEAPVPLLVGIHDSYLLNTPEHRRPSSVVFVHLDTDTITMGEGDAFLGTSTNIIPLPKRAAEKLREKLVKFGGCIHHNPQDMMRLQSAGYSFLNNEHLTPIDNFISEHGVILQRQSSVASNASFDASSFHSSRLHSHGNTSRKTSVNNAESGGGNHNAACTLEVSTNSLHQNGSNKHHHHAIGILDPANNCVEGDPFNVDEIRNAFLRFFVASFIDYLDFFEKRDPLEVSQHQQQQPQQQQTQVSPSSTASSVSGNGLPPKPDSKKIAAATGGIFKRRGTVAQPKFSATDIVIFLKDQYTESKEDPFLKQMIQTQLFSNYIAERIECPEQAEIKFFDENILAKVNRSKLTLTKNSTPFLDDMSDAVVESFSVPTPSNSGIPPDKLYSYTQFPMLSKKLFGTVRVPAVLIRTPEIKRLQGKSALLWKEELLKNVRKSPTPSVTPTKESDSSRSSTPLGMSSSEKMVDDDLDDVFEEAHRRYVSVLASVVVLQSAFRMRPERRRFNRIRRSIRTIQRYIRCSRLRRCIRNRILAKRVAVIQRNWKMIITRRRYRRILRAIVAVQSLAKKQKFRRLYLAMRRKIIVVQSVIRCRSVKKRQTVVLKSLFAAYRTQTLCLWQLEGTSLVYRSQFWSYLNAQTYLNLAIYQDELLRLYDTLGMYTTGAVFYALKSKSIMFSTKFDLVQRSGFMSKLLANTYLPAVSLKDIEVSLLHPSVNTQAINTRLIGLRKKEQSERHSLYLSLKAQDKNASIKESLFQSFGLNQTKKRKQALVDAVWIGNCSDNHAALSSQVVLKIASLSEQELMDWAHTKQREKMAKDCLASVQACLISIQRLKREKKRPVRRPTVKGEAKK